MTVAHRDFSRSLRVRAETSQLAKIRDFVEEVATAAGLDLERVFDLKVAVSEACANAVEHAGSDQDELQIDAELEGQKLTFVVTDTGVFRPPALPRRPQQSRGLGLPLMVALMDEVRFNRSPGKGTAVSLSICL